MEESHWKIKRMMLDSLVSRYGGTSSSSRSLADWPGRSCCSTPRDLQKHVSIDIPTHLHAIKKRCQKCYRCLDVPVHMLCLTHSFNWHGRTYVPMRMLCLTFGFNWHAGTYAPMGMLRLTFNFNLHGGTYVPMQILWLTFNFNLYGGTYVPMHVMVND